MAWQEYRWSSIFSGALDSGGHGWGNLVSPPAWYTSTSTSGHRALADGLLDSVGNSK